MILNTGKCAIKADDVLFVPNKAIDVDISALKKNFPLIGKMLDAKILIEVNKSTAKKIEEESAKQVKSRLEENDGK